MGELNKFCIEFSDNRNVVYYPGDAVVGNVVLELNSAIKMRGTVQRMSLVFWFVVACVLAYYVLARNQKLFKVCFCVGGGE